MFVTNTPLNRDALCDWSPTSLVPEDTNLPNSQISLPRIPPKSDIPSPTSHVPTSLVATTETNEYTPSNQPPQPAVADALPRATATPVTISTSTASPTSARLTTDQSELVQTLIGYNLPLVTVAGVMEGLLRREGPSVSGDGSGSRMAQSDVRPEAENPPDYDFAY